MLGTEVDATAEGGTVKPEARPTGFVVGIQVGDEVRTENARRLADAVGRDVRDRIDRMVEMEGRRVLAEIRLAWLACAIEQGRRSRVQPGNPRRVKYVGERCARRQHA